MTTNTKLILGAAALLAGGFYLFRFKKPPTVGPARPKNWFAQQNPTINPYASDSVGGGIGIVVKDTNSGDTAEGEYHWRDVRP